MRVKTAAHKINARKHSYLWGVVAEYLCAGLLILKGYGILRLRYRNAFGEIDIIASSGNTIIFSEVKAREHQDAALYSVTQTKQRVITNAAQGFLATHPQYAHHDLRFDVMVVTSFMHIYHLKEAWRL
jgi:putative endonuclease